MDVITKTLPTYTLTSWDLSELLPEPSEEQLSARLAGLEAAAASFERRRADLDPQMDPRAFLSILRQYEELHDLIQVIYGYASLWFYSNTGSQEALTFRNRVRQAVTESANRYLFFTLWWRNLSDEEAWRLLTAESVHRDYRQYLEELRRFKPHTLDVWSELIINI
jgi:oligoendopeptidase F